MIISKLREHKLFFKLEKYEFTLEEIEFFGYKVKMDDIQMDPKKF